MRGLSPHRKTQHITYIIYIFGIFCHGGKSIEKRPFYTRYLYTSVSTIGNKLNPMLKMGVSPRSFFQAMRLQNESPGRSPRPIHFQCMFLIHIIVIVDVFVFVLACVCVCYCSCCVWAPSPSDGGKRPSSVVVGVVVRRPSVVRGGFWGRLH